MKKPFLWRVWFSVRRCSEQRGKKPGRGEILDSRLLEVPII
jgi:hypothetical protein